MIDPCSFYVDVDVCAFREPRHVQHFVINEHLNGGSSSSRFFVVALGGKYKRATLKLCGNQSFLTVHRRYSDHSAQQNNANFDRSKTVSLSTWLLNFKFKKIKISFLHFFFSNYMNRLFLCQWYSSAPINTKYWTLWGKFFARDNSILYPLMHGFGYSISYITISRSSLCRLNKNLGSRKGSRTGNSGNYLELQVLTQIQYVPWIQPQPHNIACVQWNSREKPTKFLPTPKLTDPKFNTYFENEIILFVAIKIQEQNWKNGSCATICKQPKWQHIWQSIEIDGSVERERLLDSTEAKCSEERAASFQVSYDDEDDDKKWSDNCNLIDQLGTVQKSRRFCEYASLLSNTDRQSFQRYSKIVKFKFYTLLDSGTEMRWKKLNQMKSHRLNLFIKKEEKCVFIQQFIPWARERIILCIQIPSLIGFPISGKSAHAPPSWYGLNLSLSAHLGASINDHLIHLSTESIFIWKYIYVLRRSVCIKQVHVAHRL